MNLTPWVGPLPPMDRAAGAQQPPAALPRRFNGTARARGLPDALFRLRAFRFIDQTTPEKPARASNPRFIGVDAVTRQDARRSPR